MAALIWIALYSPRVSRAGRAGELLAGELPALAWTVAFIQRQAGYSSTEHTDRSKLTTGDFPEIPKRQDGMKRYSNSREGPTAAGPTIDERCSAIMCRATCTTSAASKLLVLGAD
jgi:hypothetical protein